MNIFFSCIGPKGGVTITAFTDFYTKESRKNIEQSNKIHGSSPKLYPYFIDISCHSKSLINEHDAYTENCTVTGGDCYCGYSSSLKAEKFIEGFVHGGTEWLYKKLKEVYLYYFESGTYPDLTPIPIDLYEDYRKNTQKVK